MTTTTDPYGAPSTVFNRSGASIQEITVTAGAPVPVVVPSGVSTLIVDSNTSTVTGGIELPSGEVGDVIYVYNVDSGWDVNVHPASGETIYGYPSGFPVSAGRGVMLFKRNATDWVYQ